MLFTLIVIICFIGFATLIIETLKKIDSKLFTKKTKLIKYDISDNIELINYTHRELFEIREISDDGALISFHSKHLLTVSRNSLLGLMLLIPILAIDLYWQTYNEIEFSNFIAVSKELIIIFLFISSIYLCIKYFLCETLIIQTRTGLCIRKKFCKSRKFSIDNINNILVIKEKNSSKIHLHIFLEIANSNNFLITSIGKYNFLDMHGDNEKNALSLAFLIAKRLKKDILISE